MDLVTIWFIKPLKHCNIIPLKRQISLQSNLAHALSSQKHNTLKVFFQWIVIKKILMTFAILNLNLIGILFGKTLKLQALETLL